MPSHFSRWYWLYNRNSTPRHNPINVRLRPHPKTPQEVRSLGFWLVLYIDKKEHSKLSPWKVRLPPNRIAWETHSCQRKRMLLKSRRLNQRKMSNPFDRSLSAENRISEYWVFAIVSFILSTLNSQVVAASFRLYIWSHRSPLVVGITYRIPRGPGIKTQQKHFLAYILHRD